MMNIEKYWEVEQTQDDDLNEMLTHSNFKKSGLPSPLKKLKQTLFANLILVSPLIFFEVVLIIHFQYWQFQLAMVLVLGFSFWSAIDTWLLYKRMRVGAEPYNNVLTELRRQYANFQSYMLIQQKAGLFFYPISITAGFMLGLAVNTGKSINYFMSHPPVLLALFICQLILVPCCYYFVKYAFIINFGRQMKLLKKMIDELEGD